MKDKIRKNRGIFQFEEEKKYIKKSRRISGIFEKILYSDSV